MVQAHLGRLPSSERAALRARVEPYLHFRAEMEVFHKEFLSHVCTKKCFESRHSDCCNREGIAVFFSDIVVCSLCATEEEADRLIQALKEDAADLKCVYLGDCGCLWPIKPIVCEMFLCDHAKIAVLSGNVHAREQWEDLCIREKRFTWPDRPVLFDELESLFIQAGYESPLMYFHRSPGLLRVKGLLRRPVTSSGPPTRRPHQNP